MSDYSDGFDRAMGFRFNFYAFSNELERMRGNWDQKVGEKTWDILWSVNFRGMDGPRIEFAPAWRHRSALVQHMIPAEAENIPPEVRARMDELETSLDLWVTGTVDRFDPPADFYYHSIWSRA